MYACVLSLLHDVIPYPFSFFALEQYFCSQSLGTGCLFFQILKSIQRIEEAILFFLGFFSFFPS